VRFDSSSQHAGADPTRVGACLRNLRNKGLIKALTLLNGVGAWEIAH
jgi:hypothetical protein